MLSCAFDSQTRLVRSKAQGQQEDTVCPHLAPGLTYLLSQGSRVTEINRLARALIDLDIVLDQAADPRDLRSGIREGVGAEPWVNFDTHYPLSHGRVCASCRPALAWSGPPIVSHRDGAILPNQPRRRSRPC